MRGRQPKCPANTEAFFAAALDAVPRNERFATELRSQRSPNERPGCGMSGSRQKCPEEFAARVHGSGSQPEHPRSRQERLQRPRSRQ